MEKTLVQLLVEELKCRSCFSQMSPPLIHCCRSHHECNNCIEVSEKCSVCQIPRKYRRDYFLENVCFRTTLKCSFSSEGCPFSDKALEVANHESTCIFGLRKFIYQGTKFIREMIEARREEFSELDLGDGLKAIEDELTKLKAAQCIERDSSGESLEDLITLALECPVCFTRISPPIAECHNGHRVCQSCFDQIEECPVCRGPKCLGSSNYLTRLFNKLKVSCKNACNGCGARMKGTSIMNHEMYCTFASKPCPLKNSIRCKWEGIQSDFVDHCKMKHSNLISLESGNTWVLKDFKNYRRSHYSLIHVHGVLFRCCWQVYRRSRRFSVSHIKDKYSMKLYTFQLRIVFSERNYSIIVPGGVCSPVTEFRDRPKPLGYAVLTDTKVSDFCDSHGDLCYVVEINK